MVDGRKRWPLWYLLLWAAVLVGLFFPAPVGGQPVPDSLLREIGQIAGNYPNEMALCLTHDGFRVPYSRYANESTMHAESCGDGTVAFWHSHPAKMLENGRFYIYYHKHTGEEPDDPRDLCYLSGTDVESGHNRSPPWQVVQVDAETWCWWSAEQVEGLDAGKAIHRPPAGQTSWADES